MSLGATKIDRLVAHSAPVLCVDTCAILNVVRDITRESLRVSDVHAGLALLKAAETGDMLLVLMAEQVRCELTTHISSVEEEAEKALRKFSTQAQRINDVAIAFGAQGMVETEHFRGHVTRARAVLDRWTAVAHTVAHDAEVTARAFRRVNG